MNEVINVLNHFLNLGTTVRIYGPTKTGLVFRSQSGPNQDRPKWADRTVDRPRFDKIISIRDPGIV